MAGKGVNGQFIVLRGWGGLILLSAIVTIQVIEWEQTNGNCPRIGGEE